MKKSLVLAMAMALGVTASAYAANPFSDVPAGHWAYDSINKLAAAGVIEGYGDTTFGGDKLMTRYEMAQIVAKAMAKGANVDKLAAEFADELDNLGVRVANLEKKADNVKVTGEVRYLYKDIKDDSYENNLRSRLWVNGQINDDWSYTGMIENTQYFDNNNGDEKTEFNRAYVEGKIGGLAVTAGRYNAFLANGNVYDDLVDGAEVSYGDKVKVTGFAGKATEVDGGNYAGGELAGAFGDLNLAAGYVNYKDLGDVKDLDDAIWYVGADYTMGDVNLSAMYLKGDASEDGKDITDVNTDGWTAGLAYKGAEASEAGSWGLFANYYDLGGMTYIAHTTDAETFNNDGFKGYGVGANYAFAKNIVGTVAYYDTENKLDSSDKARILWTDLTFTF
ncbi:porin [Phascolarctobacterium succinatutens]|uniref:porin n=1 Tax=Phascolarctobacterium succinatutens TaxID=626940 RepID=UPI003AB7C522